MKNKQVFSYAVAFLSFTLFIYVIIIHLLNFLFPDEAIFAAWVIKMPELRFLLSSAFGLDILGIFWEKRSFKKIFSVPQAKKEIFLYFISAFSLAYFYQGSFSLFGHFPFLSLLFLLIFFFFFLPSLVEFYLDYDPVALLRRVTKQFRQFEKRFLPSTGLIGQGFIGRSRLLVIFLGEFKRPIFSFLTLVSVLVVIIGLEFSYLSIVRGIRSSFYIESVTPTKNIYGEKEVIRGYNFGWKDSGQYKLMSDQGEIVTHLWTGSRIVFIVPLHLKQNKTAKLWLIKPENGRLIRTNYANFTVLDRTKFYPVTKDSLKTRILKELKRFFLLDNKYLNKLL